MSRRVAAVDGGVVDMMVPCETITEHGTRCWTLGTRGLVVQLKGMQIGGRVAGCRCWKHERRYDLMTWPLYVLTVQD